MLERRACHVLLVYPKFHADSFWSYAATCDLTGAKYPTAPLGLITVAAMLPPSWDVRLVNRNTEELTDADLDWADMVMTGGMLMQQPDAIDLIELCRARDLPVVVGGPDVTSFPHIYKRANFQVLGEAEGIIDEFIIAWDAGAREGVFEAPKFKIDVTKTPIPRYDLLKFEHYLYIGVQFSRGCPFTCEFCDIIELYGRVPRTKNTEQVLAELETLRTLGYRGHVDFVDDNLIGNKKAVKAFLPHLKDWLNEKENPFEFTTEASLNISDDEDLMRMMSEANFFGIFVGIESPDTETLIQMKKKQNTRRGIAESIHRIYAHGMFVLAGFIVGFDSEKGSVAQPMIDLIESTAIPIGIVGLLHALGTTQLGRRLEKEGRLHPGYDIVSKDDGDHCQVGLNFDTLRSKIEVLEDYKHVLETVYEPNAVAGRLRRLMGMLDCSNRLDKLPEGDRRKALESIALVHRVVSTVPEAREPMWKVFTDCAKTNPKALRYIVTLMSMYIHFGQVAMRLAEKTGERIERLRQQGEGAMPAAAVIADQARQNARPAEVIFH